MPKLKVSVIIPAYNRKGCVMDAVNSVLSQDRDGIDFEVIVSDDGSTDGTKSLFMHKRDARVQYLHSPKNRGVNAARNRAIRKAKGEYILLLDSDDMLTPNAAAVILSSRRKLGKVNFFGTADVKDGRKLYAVSKEGTVSYREWLEKKRLRGEFDPLIHRSVFEGMLFDEDRFCFEGFFWNRAIKKHGLVVFDRVIRLYSFEQENRVSRKLLDPLNAAKRYDDYVRYVTEFGPDYKRLRLNHELASVLKTLSVYAMLSRDADAARKSVTEAIKLQATVDKMILKIVYFFGPKMFRVFYSVARRFM